jgi:hypothetical protein
LQDDRCEFVGGFTFTLTVSVDGAKAQVLIDMARRRYTASGGALGSMMGW